MKLSIKETGEQILSLNELEKHTQIKVDKRIDANVYLTYSGMDVETTLDLELDQDSRLNLLIQNKTAHHLQIKIKSSQHAFSELMFAYCDLAEGNCTISADFQLLEEGASAKINSACIVSNKKQFDINCRHMVPHTSGLMEHYAVVNEEGTYTMKACGEILKGAYGSASHQSTRVLTMSDHHDSQVLPLLLIDEDEVMASHATTLGQPDENQLYYLQTRGLNRKQALGLLSIGYLMPILDGLKNESIKEELKQQIEMKVGLYV